MSDKMEIPAPSEEFMDAVCSSGSPVAKCGFCGRTHYASNSDLDYEEGELEELEKKARKNPDRYVCDNVNDAISWGTLNGKQAIWKCPCNLASSYESFIWKHRYVIRDYFSNKAKEKERQAKETSQLAQSVSDSISD